MVAAYALARQGVNPVLIEKSPRLGGSSRSYQDSKGQIFDSGHHALDFNRSKFTTDLFMEVLNGEYNRFPLRRGIVLGGEVFAYASPPDKWPESLQPLLQNIAPCDTIEAPLTREKISQVYGRAFTDFIYDKVLSSYPTLFRAIEEGGSISDQMRLIYPWFFPSIPKDSATNESETTAYHLAMRTEGQSQEILYPKEGGFEGFTRALAEKAKQAGAIFLLGETQSEIVFHADGKKINKIKTSQGDLVADKYLWCAPVPIALHILGKDLGLKSPQNLLLGNFSFESELSTASKQIGEFNEIIVGDNDHLINRITFPGKLSCTGNKTLQVEFLCPDGGEFDKRPDQWRGLWEQSLRTLGLITDEDKIGEFSFHTEGRGFVVPENYDDLIARCQRMYDDCDTNLEVPYFSLGPENINRIIPGVISYVDTEVV